MVFNIHSSLIIVLSGRCLTNKKYWVHFIILFYILFYHFSPNTRLISELFDVQSLLQVLYIPFYLSKIYFYVNLGM